MLASWLFFSPPYPKLVQLFHLSHSFSLYPGCVPSLPSFLDQSCPLPLSLCSTPSSLPARSILQAIFRLEQPLCQPASPTGEKSHSVPLGASTCQLKSPGPSGTHHLHVHQTLRLNGTPELFWKPLLRAESNSEA